MEGVTVVVDEFEYKGVDFKVHKDENSEYFFVYLVKGVETVLPVKAVDGFMKENFSNKTIGKNVLDIVEKSVKINDLLYNYEDLKSRIIKYKN